MTYPDDVAVIARGELPTGERWTVTAGGTATDYYTFLETVHPDGHSDEGGMGGLPLQPGRNLNTYTGAADGGLLRILARASRQVACLHMKLASGETRELLPLGVDAPAGLSFFAALLPRTETVVSLTALDADGQILDPQ